MRRLLLRTSVLERVTGPLADALTGGSGGERMLQELEQANAFVVSLDARRSWFRYHQLFADLLQLELRRTAPGEVTALHGAAAGWFAEHGYPVEAIRHAQAAQDWGLAARLLADNWLGLDLDGQAATVHELLAGFPAGAAAADAELAALAAADELARGSLEEAERYLGWRRGDSRAGVGAGRAGAGRCRLLLAVVRLLLARQRGNLPAVAEEARRLLAPAEAADAAEPGLGEDLRALALINLGIAEVVDGPLRGGGAAPRTGHRPGAPDRAALSGGHRPGAPARHAAGRSVRAGSGAEPAGDRAGPAAWLGRGAGRRRRLHGARRRAGWQGRLEEAEAWWSAPSAPSGPRPNRRRDRAALRPRDARARARPLPGGAGRLPGRRAAGPLLVAPHTLATRARAPAAGAGADGRDPARRAGPRRDGRAGARQRRDTHRRGGAAARPGRPGSGDGRARARHRRLRSVIAPAIWWFRRSCSRRSPATRSATRAPPGGALERALDLAEPEGVLFPFLCTPRPGLLERHRRHGTAHAALIAEILNVLAGPPEEPKLAPRRPRLQPPPAEPLSHTETRVLRYLPTKLSAPEIADELYLSVNTVRTHMRHLYDKLGVHRRHEAVERARALGLLAPSPSRRTS